MNFKGTRKLRGESMGKLSMNVDSIQAFVLYIFDVIFFFSKRILMMELITFRSSSLQWHESVYIP
jgi:hypothetical protein